MRVLRSNRSRALLGALLVESALLASGAWLLTHTAQAAPTADKKGPVHIALVSPPKPTPKPAPKPPPPKPKPPPPPPKPKPLPRPKPPPPKPHHVVHHAVPDPKPAPKPVPKPPPLPRPDPPPPAPVVHTLPPQPATSSQLALFAAKIHAAVQASLVYPMAARVLGLTGRTKVGFTYRDGQVSDVYLLISSGYPALDRAAIEAVKDAHYPPPPAALAGKTQKLTIWVRFKSRSSD